MQSFYYFSFEASLRCPVAEKKGDSCLHVPVQVQITSPVCSSGEKEPENTSTLQDSASQLPLAWMM